MSAPAADRLGGARRLDPRQVRCLLGGGAGMGDDNRTALGIGALMNSRGLMELIIINIGLQKGVIGPTLFSMMVLMAIVTPVMAVPLFELVYGRKARASGELDTLEGSLAGEAA
jgi:Kef-type K+ transport system membrane component KefB